MPTARLAVRSGSENSPYRSLPIDDLIESATNPRRTFTDLDALADSIKTHGVLQPVVVRPANGHFEIIAGARRCRAAQLAGLHEVPVHVVDLDDAAAQEAQIVENLQRADVPPMEEARGFKALAERDPANTPEVIAARVGRPLPYVYQRLKLLSLLPDIQDALAQDVLTISHALLLTRVATAQQAAAFDQCFHALYHGKTRENLAPLRQLRQWIDTKTQLDVRSRDTEVLLPELATTAAQHEAESGTSLLALSTLHFHTTTDEPKPVLARSWVRADGKGLVQKQRVRPCVDGRR